MLSVLEPYFAGRDFDVTEENLQARLRGMIRMAFSNKFRTYPAEHDQQERDGRGLRDPLRRPVWRTIRPG